MLILAMINLDRIVQCVCAHVCNRKSDYVTTYMEGNVKVRQEAYSVAWRIFSLRNLKLNEQILLVIISFFFTKTLSDLFGRRIDVLQIKQQVYNTLVARSFPHLQLISKLNDL